jgi:hypothetical protein
VINIIRRQQARDLNACQVFCPLCLAIYTETVSPIMVLHLETGGRDFDAMAFSEHVGGGAVHKRTLA